MVISYYYSSSLMSRDRQTDSSRQYPDCVVGEQERDMSQKGNSPGGATTLSADTVDARNNSQEYSR
ncbi:hypothetical protein EMPG_09501 [Blastomyces silverae]|uniref:Uncharacterized protein n=1 Tax=Blastomyces silverae TaxID=2060906 RepID=A0A0H1BNH8_9EURO|nr:hypothetical protein EMPG_09501 [Blastomyces silverae]